MSNLLNETIAQIKPLKKKAMTEARERQDSLAKPPKSLGRLEDLSIQLAGITGKTKNTVNTKTLLVFCADNGVVEEGVASAPQSVTLAQTINLARGKTGAAVLADRTACLLRVIDVGVNADIDVPDVINRKIRYGTDNITNGPAMSEEDAVKAIETGIEEITNAIKHHDAFTTAMMNIAKDLQYFKMTGKNPKEKEKSRKEYGNVHLFGIGEMGIGNTTTSAAVLSVLTGKPVREVTGRGAGIIDDAYENKIHVIEKAIELNRPDPEDVIDVIRKVGGLDIAAMTGAFLGAAANRCPVVIDGFISAVGALCAARLCPKAKEYFIPSHASFEIGYKTAMDELGLTPLFDLQMRLGEGSGCPIAMQIIEDACHIMNDMATFAEAEINDDYLEPIRNTDAFTVKNHQPT